MTRFIVRASSLTLICRRLSRIFEMCHIPLDREFQALSFLYMCKFAAILVKAFKFALEAKKAGTEQVCTATTLRVRNT